jgi:hypothetical protein
MKLFQIEEPDGTPLEGDGPGMAVGIELSAETGGAVAVAVGGNAELLPGADGTTRLPVAGLDTEEVTAALLLALRERAEKALARPVTHAVVALASPGAARAVVEAAAAKAGLVLLKVAEASELALRAPGARPADAPVLGAAIEAEDEAAPLAR